MEKKTIGKFISVLRKAKGMTQQELADKLLVSDKTVSKWERDERMPDISLLPAIAEIFGITTDELLRGERNNPEREGYGTEETEAKQTAKSEKQLNNMLNKKMRIYNSLTCLSVIIMLLGFILGFLFVLYLQDPLMVLVCFGFMVVAQVCQVIFANNALIRPDEDELCSNRVGIFNSRVIDTVAWFTIANISITVCFVLTLNELFGNYLGAGCIIAITIMLAEIIYIVYALAVRKAFVKRGLIVYNDERAKIIKYRTKLLKRMVLGCGIGAIVLFVVGFSIIGSVMSWDRYYVKYDDVDEFKAQIEGEYDTWCEYNKGNFWAEVDDGEFVFLEEEYKASCEAFKQYGEIKGRDGQVLCEYYCLSSGYDKVIVDYDKNGNIEIGYKDDVQYNLSCAGREIAWIHFCITVATYFGVCAMVYIIWAIASKKKVLAEADEEKAATQTVEEEMVEQAN